MTKPSYKELRITKHSGSPQIADSARGGKSSKAAKETRKARILELEAEIERIKGTTADKSGSREPEKLNSAHNEKADFKQLLQELVSVQAPYDHDNECSFCGSMEGKEHHEECAYRKAKLALAESSLSSPPPKSDSSAPTPPEATGLSIEQAEGRTAKENR